MTDTTERLCAMALTKVPNLGPVLARKLITAAGSAREVIDIGPRAIKEVSGTRTASILAWNKDDILSKARAEFESADRRGIRILFYKSLEFPKLLLNCHDHPLFLYQKGELAFEGRRMISIVGTRAATNWGKGFCQDLVAALAPYNPVVVSGLAFGIDIATHRAALAYGLDTVACLAHGLDKTYPTRHKQEAQRIVEQGCLLSEYGVEYTFEKPNFIARNRIIAGLSKATVVVESAFKGGSLVTVDLALSYNREVYAVPGRPSDAFSEGCNALIRDQKAQLIYKPQDLLDHLNWQSLPREQEQRKVRMWLELPEEHQRLVGFLESGRKSMDQLLVASGWPIAKLSALLFDLELKQLVRAVKGQQYELCQ